MPYSAMIFLILAILAALLGFGPVSGDVAQGARVLAVAFSVLCAVTLALPYLRRRADDTDRA